MSAPPVLLVPRPGASSFAMMRNCLAPYIVFATSNLGYAVVVEAALSFLGVGTPPDVPSWGGMLSITGQGTSKCPLARVLPQYSRQYGSL